MFLSGVIMTDSCRYFSTAALARRTSSAPSISDINSAPFTQDGLKNQQLSARYLVLFLNVKECAPKVVILCKLSGEIPDTFLGIAGGKDKTIYLVLNSIINPLQ